MYSPMKFFWGLVIAGTGLLLLGTNLGWWSASVWNTFWLLWPMIFIVIGIRFLVNNDLAFSIIALALVVATGYLIIAQPANIIGVLEGRGVKTEELSDNVPSGADKMTMKLNIGSARVTIGALDSASGKLYELKTKNLGKIVSKTNSTNGASEVTISEEFDPSNINVRFNKRELTLNISRSILTDLTVDSGASNLGLDLSELKITNLDLNSGASSGEIKFGDKVDQLNANIDTGASQVTLLVPKNVGLRFDFGSSALNGQNFSGLDLTENNKVFQTKDYDSSAKKINVKVSAGVSNFEIKSY